RVLFSGDWNNAAVTSFNNTTTFGDNNNIQSYHTIEFNDNLTIGDSVYVYLVNNTGTATFVGDVVVGNAATGFRTDRSATFSSTLTFGDYADAVYFAVEDGTTQFDGDVFLGKEGDYRFDRGVYGNNQNITVGEGTQLEFYRTTSPGLLHNLTLTRGTEIIFEEDKDYNFSGEILMTAPYLDCSGGNVIRSEQWSTQTRLNFTTDHNWYGVIVQTVAVSGANISAIYSTDYQNNTGITFDNSAASEIATTLYWVGGTEGNTKTWPYSNSGRTEDWGNPQNWSTTSGGYYGSCIPREQHDVIFDHNSFTDTTNLSVDVNISDAVCHDMTWTTSSDAGGGVINTPDLEINNDLSIAGSLVMSDNPMTVTGNRDIYFISTSTGETITSNGTALDNDDVFFNGLGGEWTFQDDFDMSDEMYLQAGHLITGTGLTITMDNFDAYEDASFTDVRRLTVSDNSTMVFEGQRYGAACDLRGTDFTFDTPGTGSTFMFTYNKLTGTTEWTQFKIGNTLARELPDIIIDGPRDIDFDSEDADGSNSNVLTFRSLTRLNTTSTNFNIAGTSPKIFNGDIDLGSNLDYNVYSNYIEGNSTVTNVFNGEVIFGDNVEMDFRGLNQYVENVTFGDNNFITFQTAAHELQKNLVFGDQPTFYAYTDISIDEDVTIGNDLTVQVEQNFTVGGDVNIGTGSNGYINRNGGQSEITGSLTIGANANQLIFRQTGIFHGSVDIGDNAIVQFAEGGNYTSTFNDVITTGNSAYVRFQETSYFNAALTTGNSSTTVFGEDSGETYFEADVTLGANSNNHFYEFVYFDSDDNNPVNYTLTLDATSTTEFDYGGSDDGLFENIQMNTGSRVIFDNDDNTIKNLYTTEYNTIELSTAGLTTIQNSFEAAVDCDEWLIIRSSDPGSTARIAFEDNGSNSMPLWNHIVVQDVRVEGPVSDLVDGSGYFPLEVIEGVNLDNLNYGRDKTSAGGSNPFYTDEANMIDHTHVDYDQYATIYLNAERTPLTLYWVGQAGQVPPDGGAANSYWSNANNWSTVSGSTNPADISGCIPNPIDHIIFDDNSFTADNQTVIIDISNAACGEFTFSNTEESDITFEGQRLYFLQIFDDYSVTNSMVNNFLGTVEFYTIDSDVHPLENTNGSIMLFNGPVSFISSYPQTSAPYNWRLDDALDLDEGAPNDAYDTDFTFTSGVVDGNAQDINLEGDWIILWEGGYRHGGSSTVTFDGDEDDRDIDIDATIADNPFYNVVVDKTTYNRDLRLRNNIYIDNDLTINSGKLWDSDEGWEGPRDFLTNGSGATGAGIITINDSGSLVLGNNDEDAGDVSEFPATFADAILTIGSTVIYHDRDAQNVSAVGILYPGVEYGNLTLENGDDNTTDLKTLQGDIVINGNLRIDDTFFEDNGYAITGNVGDTSKFEMTEDSRFYIGTAGVATIMPEFDNYDFENNSRVYYQSANPQIVKGIDDGGAGNGSYANLYITNLNEASVTTSVLKTIDAPLRIRRELRIEPDAELWDDGNQITALDDDNCELFMSEDSYLTFGNASTATTFPNFQSDEISLDIASVIKYVAGVDGQQIRRLDYGNNDLSYASIWLLNYDSVNTTVVTKYLAATPLPRNSSDNLRFRQDFKVGEYNHLMDDGFQINGENSDLSREDYIWVGQQSILTLGTATTATEFPRYTETSNIDLHATSHVIYNAGVDQIVRGIFNDSNADDIPDGDSNYGFLTIRNIDNSSLITKTLDERIGVRRDFIIENNNHLVDAGYQIYGTSGQPFNMEGNSQLTLGDSDDGTSFPLNYANADVDLASATTITYNGGVAQDVRRLSSGTSNQNYANLIFQNVGGSLVDKTLMALPVTADASDNVTIRGSLQILSNNHVIDDGYQIVGTGGQTFEMESSSQLTIGNATVATVFPQNYLDTDINFDAASIIIYNAGVAQDVKSLNSSTDSQVYGEVQFINAAGGSDVNKTLLGALRFRTAMRIYDENHLLDAGNQITGSSTADFEMQGTSEFFIGDAALATLFPIDVDNDNVSLASGTTIHYQSTSPQQIRKLAGAVNSVENYANLNLTGSTKTITASPNATSGYTDNLHVRGVMSINDQQVELNDQRLVISGNITRTTGTFTGTDNSMISILGTSGGSAGELHFTDPSITNLSDLLVNRTGANGSITLGTLLTIGTNPGDNGSLTLTNGELILNGNRLLINSAANQFNRTNGTITGSSSSTLIVQGAGDFGDDLVFTSGSEELNELGIDRTGDLVMGSTLFLYDKIGLKSGIIHTTNTNLITLGALAEVRDFDTDSPAETSIHPSGGPKGGNSGFGSSGGSQDSHIQGPMAKVFTGHLASGKSFRFPIGKNGELREIGVAEVGKYENDSSLFVTWPTVFRAEYFKTEPPKPGSTAIKSGSSLTHVSSVEYWDLHRSSGDASAKVIMHWDTDTDVATDASQYDNLRVAHYDDSSEEWESIGDGNELDYDTDLGYFVSSVASDDFSYYTPASTTLYNLLPIELKSFTAEHVKDKGVDLNWEAVERNSEGYILQRSIGNTENFEVIAHYEEQSKLVSKNESVTTSKFNYLDKDGIEPGEVHYYMLQQVDKDGNVETFDIKSVNVGAKVVLYQNHPNPSGTYTTLSFSIEKEAKTKLEIFDMSGRFIATVVDDVLESGTHQYEYNVSRLKTGVYAVKMTYGDKVLNIKMLVSK
ncbi:MAG: hypothetical protein CMO01_30320, partial [Thalassobius sp.]|nr:hypothetical protein [Thalassovita sp.]